MVANLIELLTMDKIIKVVLNALKEITFLLKTTYDFIKEGLVKKLLFYIFNRLLKFGKGYSNYLATGVILLIFGLAELFGMIDKVMMFTK